MVIRDRSFVIYANFISQHSSPSSKLSKTPYLPTNSLKSCEFTPRQTSQGLSGKDYPLREIQVRDYNNLIDFNSLGDLMKTAMKFLSLLLCFELVISPLRGSLFLPAEALAQTCPAGQAWNSSLGRCNVTQETLNTSNAVDSCGDNKKCLEDIAKGKAAATSENPFGKRGGTVGTGIASAAAIGIPLLIVTTVLVNKAKAKKAEASFSCKPPSLLLMYAAAAALAVGEIYGYFNHKSKLDAIQKKWDDTVVHKAGSGVDKRKTEATEAQSQAFEFLAQNEDQVAKTAKTKKGFYLAATGLFAAGAIAATVEAFQLKAAKTRIKLTDQASLAARPADIQTVQKLTCSTDEAAQKADEAETTRKEGEAKKLEEQEKIKADEKKLDELKAEKKGLEDKKCAADPACATKKLESEASTRDAEIKRLEAEKAGREKKFEKPNVPTEDEPVCTPTMQMENLCFSAPKPKTIEGIEKMQRVAAYNLSTAKDAEQLMQLMNEMNSVEFENYSKVSYIEEDMAKDLKQIPLLSEITNHIANVLVPNACAAGDSACSAADTAAAAAEEAAAAAVEPEKKDNMSKILGVGGTVITAAVGLKSILGGVKLNGGTPLKAGELDGKIQQTGGWLMKQIGKPVVRIGINGVLGGWMGIMAGHMNKQMKLAKERAKTLREMKEEFVTANGLLTCKEEDRANSCKPICYCYTPDNKKNPARAKDTVCANRFSKMAYDPFGQSSGNDKVCLDQNSVVDPKCACRAKKNCMKITSGFSMKGFKPGTFKMISAGSAPAQDLLNGNLGGGDISDSAGINAARIKAAADQMLAKGDPKAAKEKDAFAASLEKGLIASGAGLSMGGGTNALPSSPAGAAAALDKELKEKKEDDIAKAGSRTHGADFNDEIEMPDAPVATDEAGTEEIEIAEVMEKEIDTGDSDINSGSHTNIFDVLSNRYKRSGMRRLFEGDNSAPADAPNKTEIVE